MARWALAFAVAVTLCAGSMAQDIGTVTTPDPAASASSNDTAVSIPTAPAVPTETLAAPTATPSAAPTVTTAAVTATITPTMTPSTSATPSATVAIATPTTTPAVIESTSPASSPGSGVRGMNASSYASESTANSSGILSGPSTLKTVVLSLLGGIGFAVVVALAVVSYRHRSPEVLSVLNVDQDGPRHSSPRSENHKAATLSGAGVDLASRCSHTAGLIVIRGTNDSSEQRFSIREGSDISVRTYDRELRQDGDSMSDRYSTAGRYSTSSRLSSEQWFQGSASSTASSFVGSRSRTGPTITTQRADVSANRTDVPDWYRVIESPTATDRYTASSLCSDIGNNERESFEL